jgi:hypothetical protein
MNFCNGEQLKRFFQKFLRNSIRSEEKEAGRDQTMIFLLQTTAKFESHPFDS